MAKLPNLIAEEITKAKDGHKTSSIQLIRELLLSLKSGVDLSSDLKSYLIECLERTLKDDANKGFYLEYGRGKKKSDTFQRDCFAAHFMLITENSDLNYDERLSITVREMNEQFSEQPGDKKTVEAAYTEYREAVLIIREIEQEAYSK